MISSRARVAGLTTIIALGGALALLAPASEAQRTGPSGVVIKMVQDGRSFKYAGPSTIAKGDELTFKNKTDVRKGGPHTASLVEPGLVPRGRAEQKACGRDFEGVCGPIAFTAHRLKIEGERFTVRRPDFDTGKRGWDTAFGRKGDTWFSETLGETETRKVTARAGSTLTFFCAVHPEMVKKIKVTE
ncbi:MAG: hypothetical protein WKF94_08655 [Solirubrobacteraceae bacterium]